MVSRSCSCLVIGLLVLAALTTGCAVYRPNPLSSIKAHTREKALSELPSPSQPNGLQHQKAANKMLDIFSMQPPGEVSVHADRPERLQTHSILVVGDSLSVGLGITMADVVKGIIKVRPEGKISSGLSQNRVLDWDKKLKELIAAERPDALVVLMGGNDANIGSTSQAWTDNYRGKIQAFLQIPVSFHIPVFWVELPPMENKGFTQRVEAINEAAASVCSKINGCHYLPTWDLCANDKGEYTVAKTWQGRPVVLRVPDGTHFTRIGYETLSRYILSQMAKLIDMPTIAADQADHHSKPTHN